MILFSGCPPRPPDHPRTRPKTGSPTPPPGARPNPDHLGQQANHGVRPCAGLLQPFAAGRLDLLDLLRHKVETGHVAVQLSPGVRWQGRALRRAQGIQTLQGIAHGRLEAPHTQANQGRFDPVHDPGALAHQAFALAGGAPGILVRKGWDGGHVTMLRLAPQPAQEHALEQGGVEPVGLGAPMLARDRDAGRVNDMGLDAVSPEPARQPEAIAASLEGDSDACDLSAGLAGLLTPAVEELEEGVLVRRELLERMTLDPRNNPRHQPTRLAHLDHRNDRAILIQRGEASVQIGWLWHGATPSVIQCDDGAISSPPAP